MLIFNPELAFHNSPACQQVARECGVGVILLSTYQYNIIHPVVFRLYLSFVIQQCVFWGSVMSNASQAIGRCEGHEDDMSASLC
jgi:hypothetical protein